MSLFLPLSADQYHAKPMAISSITCPVGVHSSGVAVYENNSHLNACQSPSSSSTNSDTISPPPTSSKSGSSSPPCRSFSNYSAASSTSSFPSSPNVTKHKPGNSLSSQQSSSYYHPYHNCVQGTTSETDNGNTSSTAAPLSLHERRLRNKTASAKYRAKKNQQHGEMRSMISSLTKENELLLRQLDHVQHENGHLKTTCDRLRGKIMAQKMLKQYLVEAEQQQPAPGNTTIDNCYLHYHAASNIDHRKFPDAEEKGNWDKRD